MNKKQLTAIEPAEWRIVCQSKTAKISPVSLLHKPKENDDMKKLLILLPLVTAFALTACSGSSTTPVEITLEAVTMKYQPATFEVAAGQPVRLTFHNNDSVEHDFSIMEIPMAAMGATAEPMAGHTMDAMTTDPELHMAALMGQTNTIEFTPTKPGTYEFFCTVPGHKEAGMVGTLVVKSP